MEIQTLLWQFQIFPLLNVLYFTCGDNPAPKNSTTEDFQNELANAGVYYSMQTLLDAFSSEKYKDNAKVSSLVQTFKYNWDQLVKKKPFSNRKYPFIVVEGLSGISRRVVTQSLATSIGAHIVSSIPRCILHQRFDFEDDINLKRMYFAVCMYINSLNIEILLDETPVILTGYWTNQAAFKLAKLFPDVEQADSTFYEFPKDLLKPDLLIYLSSPTVTHRNNPVITEFNRRVAKVYYNIKGIDIFELNSTYISPADIYLVKRITRERLYKDTRYVNRNRY